MNIKKAVVIGVFIWLTILTEVGVLLFVFNINNLLYNPFHHLFLILIIFVSTQFYFKGRKKEACAKGGLFLGLVFVVVGLLLDAVITAPLIAGDYGFFVNFSVWVGVGEILIVSGICGEMCGRKR